MMKKDVKEQIVSEQCVVVVVVVVKFGYVRSFDLCITPYQIEHSTLIAQSLIVITVSVQDAKIIIVLKKTLTF